MEELRASAMEVAARVAAHRPPGNWNKAEVVVAMLILVYADPSRLGGTKRSPTGASQHPAVRAAAAALGRSEDAVVLKVTRRGQSLFRGRVMANYDHACAFCGLRAKSPARGASLLIASHIRPWRSASDHERLDPTNGLALCGTHDRAFDWGFMTVDESLRVVVSGSIREDYEPVPRIEAEFLTLQGAHLQQGRDFTPPNAAYLEHHRTHVFDRRYRESRRRQ